MGVAVIDATRRGGREKLRRATAELASLATRPTTCATTTTPRRPRLDERKPRMTGSTISQTKNLELAALRDQHRQLRLIIRTGLHADLVHDHHRDGVEHLAKDHMLFPSNHSHFPQVMKNWLPFVSGPEFAMLNKPGPECLKLKFSSANDSPYDTSRPVSLENIPPWIMNSLMTRWNGVFKYPAGCEPRVNSPVHIRRKFSAVFGVSSENSSILMRPEGTPPIVMSKKTTGLPRAMASSTIGSAIVTLMVSTCGAAARFLQRTTMRFRRCRLYNAPLRRRAAISITSRGVSQRCGQWAQLVPANSILATRLLVLAQS